MTNDIEEMKSALGRVRELIQFALNDRDSVYNSSVLYDIYHHVNHVLGEGTRTVIDDTIEVVVTIENGVRYVVFGPIPWYDDWLRLVEDAIDSPRFEKLKDGVYVTDVRYQGAVYDYRSNPLNGNDYVVEDLLATVTGNVRRIY